MLIRFYIRYRTNLGQSLLMELTEEGSGRKIQQELKYFNEDHWKTEIEIPGILPGINFTYRYFLKEDGNVTIPDYWPSRQLQLNRNDCDTIEVYDDWQDVQFGADVFKSRAFARVLYQKNGRSRPRSKNKFTHILHVHAPLLPPGKALGMTGSSSLLGNWADSHLLKAESSGINQWTFYLDLASEKTSNEYKYVIYDIASGSMESYEEGKNRSLPVIDPGVSCMILNQFAVFGITAWRAAGVNVQLSSLRSAKSWGVGDFSDLKKLVGWSDQVGIKMIQLLPINDTTATHTNKDSYPYAAVSAFALHPLFLDIERIASATGVKPDSKMKKQAKVLNSLPSLAYEEVLKLKTDAIRLIFDTAGNEFLQSDSFCNFYSRHHYWLMPYAAFCYLRDTAQSADPADWGEFAGYDHSKVAELTDESSKVFPEIAFHYFLQFHLEEQLHDAVEYAHKKGIIIKGDLPIGVGRNSVDTWMEPHLFHMDMQAGAPPDAFTAKGQNWSFPTYNWDEMRKDDYAWWRKRLQQMSHYYDAIRIDHVLGFFRIWSIPSHALEGILGYFVPAHPYSADDFSREGLHFDDSRYADPFMNDESLFALFGEHTGMIKDKLIQNGRLAADRRTQRGLVKWCEVNGVDDAIKNKLLDLSSDVILLRDEARQGCYHFRISMHHTASYKNLPLRDREILDRMYHDYFFRRQNELWYDTARSKLDAIQQGSDMMICAEDLGMVPEMVEGVLKQREMLALQVQRMPKVAGKMFSDPSDAPYLCVITPSTHDMSTVRQWWEEDRNVSAEFYHHRLKMTGPVPEKCNPEIAGGIIKDHLRSPAMWSVFLLQDLLATDASLMRQEMSEERINDPANPDYFWNYRVHIPIEELRKNESFNTMLREWIKSSGR